MRRLQERLTRVLRESLLSDALRAELAADTATTSEASVIATASPAAPVDDSELRALRDQVRRGFEEWIQEMMNV